ncbi:hypothetical protein [Arthrobacter mobilis]|uniref:Uncharacterized protein n=1 Tax=Arthrobacter mobilis TaxID=2724944 RepID=A0A7X6K5I3_9MICC|nr:hypothetical protein [Arthrobacter mobilis]NKX54264.1 hypothetical protein [Arthrobacter mobilis]
MRKPNTLLRGATAVAAALALLAGGTPPAHAAEREVDVTGFAVQDIVFDGFGCQNLPVTVEGTVREDVAPGDLWMSADIYRSRYLVSTADFPFGETETRTFICSWYGLGKYKIGPTTVGGLTADDVFELTDPTSTSFHVRGKARASLGAKRSGNKVTLTARATYYRPESLGYRNHSPKGAEFQVKSRTGWRTVTTVDFVQGKASHTVSRSAKGTYRVVLPQTTSVTAATSPAVRK